LLKGFAELRYVLAVVNRCEHVDYRYVATTACFHDGVAYAVIVTVKLMNGG
jgi:hypothetical protein